MVSVKRQYNHFLKSYFDWECKRANQNQATREICVRSNTPGEEHGEGFMEEYMFMLAKLSTFYCTFMWVSALRNHVTLVAHRILSVNKATFQTRVSGPSIIWV